MQVIILVAGRGKRLWPLTRNTPKSLLQIGNGVTLLEHQLENIKQISSISEVCLVIGYRAEQIEAKLQGMQLGDLRVKTIYNPFFDVSNNLVSLWFARPYMSDQFIVLNGDDVFKSQVMHGLVESPGEITMTIDHKETYDEDDMKVVVRDDLVKKVSKKIPVENANGESIGMIRFAGTGARKLKNTLDLMIREEASKNIFWLAAIQRMMDEGFPVYPYVCAPTDWAEVDFHPDLNLIRQNIDSYLEDFLEQ